MFLTHRLEVLVRRPALAGRCLEPGAPWGSPRLHLSLAEAGKPREGKLTQITEELKRGGGGDSQRVDPVGMDGRKSKVRRMCLDAN